MKTCNNCGIKMECSIFIADSKRGCRDHVLYIQRCETCDKKIRCARFISNGMMRCENYLLKREPLKMGDIIEIYGVSTWSERIFVKHARDGGILTVYQNDETNFKKGKEFSTMYRNKNYWRRVKERSFRPYKNKEEISHLLGEKVKHLDGDFGVITYISKKCIVVGVINYTYEDFHEFHINIDNSRIGIEE